MIEEGLNSWQCVGKVMIKKKKKLRLNALLLFVLNGFHTLILLYEDILY